MARCHGIGSCHGTAGKYHKIVIRTFKSIADSFVPRSPHGMKKGHDKALARQCIMHAFVIITGVRYSLTLISARSHSHDLRT